MTKDNVTGKNKDFYDLGKKIFDRLNPQGAINPKQATTDQLYFRDPAVDPPPRGTSMLLLNPGGVCIIGVWEDSCIGWCPKPKIPKSLKEKNSE